MRGYGGVPLLRGTSFLKRVKLSVSVLKYGRSYGYLLKKHAELRALLWQRVVKIEYRSDDVTKIYF